MNFILAFSATFKYIIKNTRIQRTENETIKYKNNNKNTKCKKCKTQQKKGEKENE